LAFGGTGLACQVPDGLFVIGCPVFPDTQFSALVLRVDGSVQMAISESDGDEEEGADQGEHGSLGADCQDKYGQDECGNGQTEVEVPPELMELLLDDAGNLFGSGHRRTRCTVGCGLADGP